MVIGLQNHEYRLQLPYDLYMTSAKWCEQQLGLSLNTVIDWNNYLREVCAMAVEIKPQTKLGGPRKIVEIDESLFSKSKISKINILLNLFGDKTLETIHHLIKF
ncbi:unnamed protein product [Macrosiphum euphorbiae]|uniref:Transposase n=1 Tax=Macrosiphum euphorbiae TaxID=13131 RepID=A0AAV0Y847_9HEMI|nr:unnamed protein product [Macrosiphum euphorbiae]